MYLQSLVTSSKFGFLISKSPQLKIIKYAKIIVYLPTVLSFIEIKIPYYKNLANLKWSNDINEDLNANEKCESDINRLHIKEV